MTPTTYKYTGQREDAGLGGVLFYVARWYDPAVGRFLQADTIVPGAGNPQAFNRYSYVLNSPIKYTDPSGHCVDNDRQTTRNDQFDCSVEELGALNWEVRKWWIGELGMAGNATGWFTNIQGIIDFFKTSPSLSDLDGWASKADAGLLWAIQEGFRAVYRPGERAVFDASSKWEDFFTKMKPKSGASLSDRESAWGTAEIAGTMFGRTYADAVVGFPTGQTGDVLREFIEIGDGYRQKLATGSCAGCKYDWAYTALGWIEFLGVDLSSPRSAAGVSLGAQYSAIVVGIDYGLNSAYLNPNYMHWNFMGR